MSDEADITQDRLDNEDELKRKYRQPPKLEAEAVGVCLNCGASFAHDDGKKRWCDEHCAKDWALRQPRR